jgi:hypothetical protein
MPRTQFLRRSSEGRETLESWVLQHFCPLSESEAGRRILSASPEEQRGFVLAVVEWLDLRHGKQAAAFHETWAIRQTMQTVLRRSSRSIMTMSVASWNGPSASRTRLSVVHRR